MKKTVMAFALGLVALGVASASPRNLLVIQRSDEIVTLDPAQSYDGTGNAVIENIYEGLMRYNSNRPDKFSPNLATAYGVINSGFQYQFVLRKNVKFHSGNTMTCDDAAYSFRRLLTVNNPTSGGVFMSLALLGIAEWDDAAKKSVRFADLERAISCTSDGLLQFRLKKPDPGFLAKLLFTASSILDKKHMVEGGEWSGTASDWAAWQGRDVTQSWLSSNPSGTGAYKLVSKDADRMIFQAFDQYWGGKPAVASIVRQKVENEATRILALKNGDSDLGEVSRASLVQLRGAKGIKIIDDLPSIGVQALFFNQNIQSKKYLGSGKLDGKGIPANFFSDIDVRRGFTHAFDPSRYVKEILLGKGRWLTMALPESFNGYDATLPKFPFDRNKAIASLKRAWRGQVWQMGFTLNIIYTPDELFKGVLDILKNNLEALNPKFKLKLIAVQGSQWSAEAGTGQALFGFATWQPPDYADSDNYIRNFYSKTGYFATRTNFSDPRLEQLIEAAYAPQISEQERARLYKAVGKRALEVMPLINVPLSVKFAVVRSEVSGFAQGFNPMLFGSVLWKALSK